MLQKLQNDNDNLMEIFSSIMRSCGASIPNSRTLGTSVNAKSLVCVVGSSSSTTFATQRAISDSRTYGLRSFGDPTVHVHSARAPAAPPAQMDAGPSRLCSASLTPNSALPVSRRVMAA